MANSCLDGLEMLLSSDIAISLEGDRRVHIAETDYGMVIGPANDNTKMSWTKLPEREAQPYKVVCIVSLNGNGALVNITNVQGSDTHSYRLFSSADKMPSLEFVDYRLPNRSI